MDLGTPKVMGILNATPDSFFAASRVQTEKAVAERACQMAEEGADIIDVGACSTRPGATPVDEQEEMARLRMALAVVRRELPQMPLSVDTFRPDVARMTVEEMGADIINDVGTMADKTSALPETGTMFQTVARLRVPYILMASEPTLRDTLLFFAEKVQQLCDLGQKDIILDPGFGFGKTVQQNYELLSQMERLQVMELPILVGVSRKSMIFRTLGCTPDEALNGTTVLNTIALMKGAGILRVHDVKEAVQAVTLVSKITSDISQ